MIASEEEIVTKLKDKINCNNNIKDKTTKLFKVNKANIATKANKLNNWIFKRYTRIFIINLQ